MCELAFDSSHLMSLNAGVREVKAQGLFLGKMSQHYLVDLGEEGREAGGHWVLGAFKVEPK